MIHFFKVILKCIFYYLIILPLSIFLNNFNSFINLNLFSLKNKKFNTSDVEDEDIYLRLNEIKDFDNIY